MKKMGLSIMSLMTVSLLSSCEKVTHKVTFDANNDTTPVIIEVNDNEKIPTENIPANPTKESDQQYIYDFKEWQLNGETFDFSTLVTSDITLTACYTTTLQKYTAYFDSNKGTPVEPITDITYGSKITNVPTTTRENKIYSYEFKGWHEVEGSRESGEVFKFDDVEIKHDMNFKAEWSDGKRKQYNAIFTNTDHLKFLTTNNEPINDLITIDAGLPFSFIMEAVEGPSNDIVHIVPREIKVCVDPSTEPLWDGVTIDPAQDNKSAVVTISGDKVLGNLSITGEAILSGNYNYEMYAQYGINEISPGTKAYNESLSLTFAGATKEGGGTYALPKKENVYVRFDNVNEEGDIEWISPSDTRTDITDYLTYNETSGELVVKPKYVKANVLIATRASDYPLLENLSWDKISNASTNGAAKYIFDVGDTKTVTVNTQKHKVRIIGFDHDVDENDNICGITFEFANFISDENGYSIASLWKDTATTSGSNYDYLNSTIRWNLTGEGADTGGWYQKDGTVKSDKYKNKTVLSMLPEDLQSKLKVAKKEVNIGSGDTSSPTWTLTEFTDELFLLASKEIGCNSHGIEDLSTYSYYEKAEESKRVKHQVKTGTYFLGDDITDNKYGRGQNFAGYNYKSWGASYYLRSPNTDDQSYINSISEYGFPKDYGISYFLAYPVAPAFCI